MYLSKRSDEEHCFAVFRWGDSRPSMHEHMWGQCTQVPYCPVDAQVGRVGYLRLGTFLVPMGLPDFGYPTTTLLQQV